MANKNTVVSHTKDPEATVVKFKWGENPAGFSIEGYGIFSPSAKETLTQVAGFIGNVRVTAIDRDEEVSLELPCEIPRDLPDYINDFENDQVQTHYRQEMAKKAAENHIANNKIRDELRYYERNKYIVLVYDSFFDKELPRRKKRNTKTATAVVAPQETTKE